MLVWLSLEPSDDCDMVEAWYGFDAPNSAARLTALMSLPCVKLFPRGGGFPLALRPFSLGGEVRTNVFPSNSSLLSNSTFEGRLNPADADGRLGRPKDCWVGRFGNV